MVYQHPLAYLLGLEGLALLRAWGGEFDKEFVGRRLAEVRRLVQELSSHEGVAVDRGDTVRAYEQWAGSYDDEPRNSLFEIDEPFVHELLDAVAPGDALDAACGTGRFAGYLAARGHRVVGVDSSPDMLARARRRVPGGEFLVGDLHRLPLADGSVDLVVTGLALTHVPDLAPVLAEFARVLRSGGHLVISDVHHEIVLRGSVPHALGPHGEPGLVNAHRHTTGDFLRAALTAGFAVRRCEEPLRAPGKSPEGEPAPPPSELRVTSWDGWPWTLIELVPEAARAAWAVPAVVVWHFQLTPEV